eukprot:1374972-Prymnesium_polylepis.1
MSRHSRKGQDGGYCTLGQATSDREEKPSERKKPTSPPGRPQRQRYSVCGDLTYGMLHGTDRARQPTSQRGGGGTVSLSV